MSACRRRGNRIPCFYRVAMRRFVLVALAVFAVSGCLVGPPAGPPVWPPTTVLYDNPVLLPVNDHELVWETVVDVVDDYFKIKEEKPVRVIGGTLIEGWLDTFPSVSSTMFEPWRHDSVGPCEKLQSTLQSMRRRAKVRVIPAQGGYFVDVAVFEELEDVVQPAHATAGAATFRNDSSLTRVVSPIHEQPITKGWIPKGRDTALEQRIIEQLLARTGGASAPGASPGW
jgi:hypothetical protein